MELEVLPAVLPAPGEAEGRSWGHWVSLGPAALWPGLEPGLQGQRLAPAGAGEVAQGGMRDVYQTGPQGQAQGHSPRGQWSHPRGGQRPFSVALGRSPVNFCWGLSLPLA